mgnify:CR=1 FL=1|tara:strand:- start:87 stop:299 length:213 start_codon:yes stop_codon:yes gene_type:complete
MAYSDYKFFDTSAKSDAEKIEDLKIEITELESIYYKLDQENESETEEMKSLETLLGEKRTEFEGLGGTYD